ncbi:MAG: hypothetical protein GX971_03770 [Firmicutes bacterium]|nr:hypothetical protein [Bacillota bacterium]
MELLLAIDMGTTHIKVGTFSLDGKLHSLEMERTKTISLGSGSAVYDPEELWNCVTSILSKTTNKLNPEDRIISVSVASMGEAGLFIGQDGKPLTPIITWFDVRGKETMEEWYEKIPPEDCFSIAGLNYNYIYSVFKMLWVKKHQRDAFAKAEKWLCVPDYVYYCLTGEYATDYSIASRTMLFDVRNCKWSAKLLELAEINQELMPTPFPSGTVIGTVTGKVAQETGLPVGTPVVAGGHDHICGAFAAGVIEPGSVLDSSGTAESLIAAFSMVPELDMGAFQGFNVGCHVVPGLHYVQGGVDSSGISFDWFRQQFDEKMDYKDLEELARTAEPGSQGVVFVPHLRGGSPPVRDPYSKACFLGLRDYHTRADLIRSIHEGLSLEVTLILHNMEQVLGLEFSEILVVGGGTKNSLWMEIKSSVSGKPIRIPEVPEATLLGAALLGGIGAGAFESYQAGVEAAFRIKKQYVPDDRMQKIYGELYPAFTEVRTLATQISRIIGEF